MRELIWIPLLCLWAVAAASNLQGDDKPAENKDQPTEKEKSADAKTSREARIKSLMQQMKKIQHALVEEGAGNPPGGLLDPNELHQRMLDDQKKMQEEMMRQMQKHAAQSLPEGARVLYFLNNWSFRGKRAAQGFPEDAPPGVPSPSAAGDPAGQMKQLLQQIDMLDGPAGFPAFPGSHDPIEIGQQMVISGLEVQLKGLASRINATKDKETRQRLKEEVRESVDKVVEARKKQRDRTIKQLEKRLAELKKQGESDESADAMVKRLLEPEQRESEHETKSIE